MSTEKSHPSADPQPEGADDFSVASPEQGAADPTTATTLTASSQSAASSNNPENFLTVEHIKYITMRLRSLEGLVDELTEDLANEREHREKVEEDLSFVMDNLNPESEHGLVRLVDDLRKENDALLGRVEELEAKDAQNSATIAILLSRPAAAAASSSTAGAAPRTPASVLFTARSAFATPAPSSSAIAAAAAAEASDAGDAGAAADPVATPSRPVVAAAGRRMLTQAVRAATTQKLNSVSLAPNAHDNVKVRVLATSETSK